MGGNTSKASFQQKDGLDFRQQFHILATSPADELPQAPEMDAPPSELPALMQQVEQIEQERERLPNPGLLENCSNEIKNSLTAATFDGFQFDLQRGLGTRMSSSHSFLLGSSMIPGGIYQFGVNCALGELTDPSTLLFGKVSPDGSVDARWNQKFSEEWRMRVKSQLKSEPHASQAVVDLDYSGEDYTLNFKLSNGPLIGMTYFQSITKNVALGGEGYFYGKHRKVISQYYAKYSSEKWAGVVSSGAMGIYQFQYLRRVGERTKYASELNYNHSSGESHATIGIDVDLRQSHFLTTVNEEGKILTVLESKILPTLQLSLSAEAMPTKDEFKFGYGIQMSI